MIMSIGYILNNEFKDDLIYMATKPKCAKENYPCEGPKGTACISRSKKCKGKPSEESQKNATKLKETVAKAKERKPKTDEPEQKKEVENVSPEQAGEELKQVAKAGQASFLGGETNELAMVQAVNKKIGVETDSEITDKIEANRQLLGDKNTNERIRQAEDMINKSLDWAKANGFEGNVTGVVWTARPGSMAAAGISGQDGKAITQAKHPADVVLQFDDGKNLGLSAKSTLGKSDITFKNRGAGTLGSSLGVDLSAANNNAMNRFTQENGLSSSSKERKAQIRANPDLVSSANAARTQALGETRDTLLNSIKDRGGDFLRSEFLDTDDQGLRYIKVTGTSGDSRISDPNDNRITRAIASGQPISYEPKGNDTVNVIIGGEKVFGIRAKAAGQAMASSIKFDVKA